MAQKQRRLLVEGRAATQRAALPEELWAWAAPHLSPRYEALRRR